MSLTPVGILAAAGAGRRFGGRKLLAPLADGTPVARASLDVLLAVLPRVVAVVPPDEGELGALLSAGGAELVVNPEPSRGLGSSLALGVGAAPDAPGWVLALGDMPFIRTATVEAVVVVLAQGAAIAAPVHAGRRGHPVGFSWPMGERLRALEGDVGARALLDEDPERVVRVEVDDPGIHRDVDLPHDL